MKRGDIVGKVGRKSNIGEWLTADRLEQLTEWAALGLTDIDIAKNIGIGISTYYRWQDKEESIRQAIQEGKRSSDNRVENALYQRALGYDYWEEVESLDSNGEMRLVRRVKKHVPADTTSMIFWLKNRQPETWRDVKKIDSDITVQSNPFDGVTTEDIKKLIGYD